MTALDAEPPRPVPPGPPTRGWKRVAAVLLLLLVACGWEGLSGRAAIDQAARLPYGFDALVKRPGAQLPAGLDPFFDASAMMAYQPWDTWSRQMLVSGHLPLWQPSHGLGIPLLGNGQASPFNPLKVLLWPSATGPREAWYLMLRLAVAGLGMLLLARSLALGPLAAGVAAVAYALNGFFLYHFTMEDLQPLALLPWLLTAGLAVARRPGAREVGVFGLLFGLTGIVGHAEAAVYAGLAAALVAGLAVWTEPAGRPRGLLAIGLAVGLGALVAGIAVLPFLEVARASASYIYVRESSLFTLQDYTFGATARMIWHHLLAPDARPTPYLFNPGVGAAALALAVPGLAVPAVRRVALPLIGLAALILLACPPANLLPAPPLAPSSLYGMAIASLGLALLAGAGAQLSSTAARSRAALVGLGACLALAGLAWRDAVHAAIVSPLATPPGHGLAMAATGLAAGALLLGRTGRLAPGPVGALLLLAVMAELGPAFRLANPALPPFAYEPSPAVRYLQAQPGPFRVAGGGYALGPDTASMYGLESPELLEAFVPLRYATFYRALHEDAQARIGVTFLLKPDFRASLLDLTNTRFLLAADPAITARLAAAPSRYVPVFRQPGVTVYRNATALPRARVLHAAVFLPPDPEGAAKRLIAGGDHWRDTALVETPDGRPPAGWADHPGPPSLATVESGPNRVTVRTALDRPGILVLADNVYPGWQAEVDGQASPIYPTDLAFRGVFLGQGAHEVVFTYSPVMVTAGAALSGLGLLGVGGLLWLGRRRRGTMLLQK